MANEVWVADHTAKEFIDVLVGDNADGTRAESSPETVQRLLDFIWMRAGHRLTVEYAVSPVEDLFGLEWTDVTDEPELT